MKQRLAFRAARLALALCASIVATASHAAPPPAAVFHSEPDIVEAVLSPSGNRLAITTGKGQTYRGLVVIDLRPGGTAVRVQQHSDGDIHGVAWVNEDRLVYRMSDWSDGIGRQTRAPGLFAINADGSQFRSLVDSQGTSFLVGGEMRNIAGTKPLEWNHRLLRVPVPRAGEPNEEVLMARFSKDEKGIETPLWLNTRTGRTRSISVDAPADVFDWETDPRGELRVAYVQHEGMLTAYWRGPGSNKWEKLRESKRLFPPFVIKSVDEAGTLYVTVPYGPEGAEALTRYDFAAHAPSPKPLVVTPGFDYTGQLLTDGTGPALGVRVNVDAEATLWFDPMLKALQEQADTLLPGRVNRISCRRCGQPDMVALVRSYSDRDPGQLLIYKAKPPAGEAPWTNIGRVNEAINPQEMGQTTFQRIKARDGLELPVWVTRPSEAKGPLPAVVLVHGGPWVRGRTWGWDSTAQFLATRGYAVIEPEMRGSLGYGEKHFVAGFKQWGQAMQDDVTDSLRWAQKQGIASDKACIVGASYGGYSTLMGLVRDPDLYKCGVAYLAVADLDLMVSGSWQVVDDSSDDVRKYGLHELVGDPVKDAAMIAANSPVKQAARIKVPLMMAFGEDDKRVPIAHGTRMRDALVKAGNPPIWVTYPGEGHGFGDKKNGIDFKQRMEVFLAKYLK